MCGPKNLYGEQMSTSTPQPCDVDRAVRRVVHRVRPRERAGLVRELGDPRDVGQRADGVRRDREGDDLRPRSERACEVVQVERVSSWMSAKRMTRPRSCATSSQGETFASWSSLVTTISSPSRNSRAAVRVSAKLSVDMFGAERDLGRVAVEEAPRGDVRLLDQRLGADARPVRAADVRVRSAEVRRRRRRSPSRAPAFRPVRRRTRAGSAARRSARVPPRRRKRSSPCAERYRAGSVRPGPFIEFAHAYAPPVGGRVLRALLRVA